MTDKKELQPGEVEHKVKSNRVISDGGSAGYVEFELEDGGKATISASIAQAPAKEVEPTGGGDPESKAKLAQQKEIAEEAAAEPVELKGPLPEDFPGHAALAEAGINTYAQLRKAGDVTEIAGIGPATADKIAEALGG